MKRSIGQQEREGKKRWSPFPYNEFLTIKEAVGHIMEYDGVERMEYEIGRLYSNVVARLRFEPQPTKIQCIMGLDRDLRFDEKVQMDPIFHFMERATDMEIEWAKRYKGNSKEALWNLEDYENYNYPNYFYFFVFGKRELTKKEKEILAGASPKIKIEEEMRGFIAMAREQGLYRLVSQMWPWVHELFVSPEEATHREFYRICVLKDALHAYDIDMDTRRIPLEIVEVMGSINDERAVLTEGEHSRELLGSVGVIEDIKGNHEVVIETDKTIIGAATMKIREVVNEVELHPQVVLSQAQIDYLQKKLPLVIKFDGKDGDIEFFDDSFAFFEDGILWIPGRGRSELCDIHQKKIKEKEVKEGCTPYCVCINRIVWVVHESVSYKYGILFNKWSLDTSSVLQGVFCIFMRGRGSRNEVGVWKTRLEDGDSFSHWIERKGVTWLATRKNGSYKYVASHFMYPGGWMNEFRGVSRCHDPGLIGPPREWWLQWNKLWNCWVHGYGRYDMSSLLFFPVDVIMVLEDYPGELFFRIMSFFLLIYMHKGIKWYVHERERKESRKKNESPFENKLRWWKGTKHWHCGKDEGLWYYDDDEESDDGERLYNEYLGISWEYDKMGEVFPSTERHRKVCQKYASKTYGKMKEATVDLELEELKRYVACLPSVSQLPTLS